MNLRTDLAVESVYNHSGDGIIQSTKTHEDITVTTVEITTESAEKEVGKPIGKYITIESSNVKENDTEKSQKLSLIISDELKNLLPQKMDKILVCGLGNRNITPDALGPMMTDSLMITNHIIEHLNTKTSKDFARVSAIAPGVMGITGIETSDIVKGVVDEHKPSLVIAVDALCAISSQRMFNSIQITNTGINPGSGIGNRRSGLNEKTLGIPVIAIGVPTVVDATSIVYDALTNFFTKTNTIDESEKIINSILVDTKTLIVSPKDMDCLIKKCAKIIANGINLSLHKNIDFSFIENYIS